MKINILANFVGRFWSILSNFLFIPLYIHYLGFESYSVISFTLMIAGIMAVLDSGLTATLSREFARKDNNKIEKIKVYKNLETIYFIIVGVCILAIFSSSGFIAEKWLNIKAYSPDQISFFLKIISFEIGFQLLFRFYMGGLLGLEKQVAANVFQVGWGVFRNGLVVIAIIYFPTLEVFFTWQVVSTIVFTIINKIYLDKTVLGKYTLDFNFKIEKKVITKIWKFASGMLLIALVAAFNTQMDKLAISKLLSLENLGYYTLAVSISQGLIILIGPISAALLPRFTAFYSSNSKAQASALFGEFAIIVSIIVFSTMANLAMYSKDLLWIWTGDSVIAEKAFGIVPILVFSYGMIALQMLPYDVAIANGSTKLNNILGLTSLVITIPGYFILTNIYGVKGAAYVFCFVQTFTTIIYLYLINKRFLNFSFIKDILVKQILLPIILSFTTVFLLSNIPHGVTDSRILGIIWIGFSTFVTVVIMGLVFIPFQKLKLFIIKLK